LLNDSDVKTTLRLEVTIGERTTTFTFDRFPVRIGRDSANDCELRFPFVSRTHARIELSNGALVLHDEGGAHGVHVGGVRLEPNESVDLAIVGHEFDISRLHLRAVLIASDAPPPMDDEHDTVDATNVTRHYDERRIDPKLEDAHAIVLQARAASERHREAWEDIRRLLVGSLRTLDVGRRAEVVRHLAAEFPMLTREDEFARAALECGVELETSGVRHGAAELALRGLRDLAALYVPFSPPLSDAGHVLTFLERIDEALRVLSDSFASIRFAHQCETGDRDPPPPNGAELAATLLDWTRDCRPAVVDVEKACIAIVTHHAQLMSETTSAIDRVLRDLAPEGIESVARGGLLGAFRWRACWRAYRYRHERISAREEGVLGPACAALDEALSGVPMVDESEAPTWVQPRGRSGSTMLSTV
jgi:type VI secretion system protein ImpI